MWRGGTHHFPAGQVFPFLFYVAHPSLIKKIYIYRLLLIKNNRNDESKTKLVFECSIYKKAWLITVTLPSVRIEVYVFIARRPKSQRSIFYARVVCARLARDCKHTTVGPRIGTAAYCNSTTRYVVQGGFPIENIWGFHRKLDICYDV